MPTSPRALVAALVLVTIGIGVVARAGYVDTARFGPTDLRLYEERSYGVDLPDRYAEQPFWLTWTRGDGQAYVTLAADPLAQDETRSLGVSLYRFSRVGYSWLALAAVGWRFEFIPYGLFAVGMISLGVLGWIAARRLRPWGYRSLALVAVPGALISVSTDTAEAMGIALCALALVTSGKRGLLPAFLLGIVRPDFATALFLRGARGGVLVAVCGAGAVLIRLLGLGLGLPYAGLNDNLSFPLQGYVDVLGTQPPVDTAVTIGLALVAVITIGRGILHETGWARLAPLTTGLFVLMLSPAVLFGAQNSLRAAAALWLVWAVPPGTDPTVGEVGSVTRTVPSVA